VLFLLVGGIWADRLPRNRVMVLSNVVSGLSQGAIAVLLLTGHAEVWQLAALGAVNGLSSAFFFPAATGIVPQTVPQRLLQPDLVLFLLVGGIWADRLPRNRVMVLSNVVSGLSQGAIAVLLLTGHAEVWQLAALGAVNGLSSAFFFPAATGIVPQTVPQRLLQ